MTFPTHVMAGLIIGKITGSYTPAILAATLPDVDHVYAYLTNNILFKPKELWKALTDTKDPYGDQRWYLHTLWSFCLISILFFLLLPQIAVPIILGYASHLLLDAFDASDYWPLYPLKKINIRGPIKYYSFYEVLVFILLLGIYFLI